MKSLHIDPFHERRARAGMDIQQRTATNASNHYRIQHAITNLWRVHERLHIITKQDFGRGDIVRFGLRHGFVATVIIDNSNVDMIDVLIHKKRQSRQAHAEAVHVTEGYAEYLRWGYGDTIEHRPYLALSPADLVDATFATQEKTDLFLDYAFVATQGLERQLKPEVVTLAPAPDNVHLLRRW